jgi:hypothetical protein
MKNMIDNELLSHVQALIDQVDDNYSSELEFPEFVKVNIIIHCYIQADGLVALFFS